MEPIKIIAQIVGIVAMAFNILSYQGKKQKTIVTLQLFGSMLFSVNYLLLGATVGGILNIIGTVRAVVFFFGDKFKAENGTITCSELLGLEQSKEYNATPDARTAEYYKKRPCVELVKECVQIIEDELL